MSQIAFRDILPQDVPWMVEAHGRLYAADEGFDATFGPLVGSILADWLPARDRRRERAWIACRNGRPVGSILCVRGAGGMAKLRLFLIDPAERGRGLGRRMLDLCLRHARDSGYAGLTLWTHESHRAACALYRAAGLRLTDARPVRSFGQELVEQTWTIDF